MIERKREAEHGGHTYEKADEELRAKEDDVGQGTGSRC
jgi:hypothetical protein